MTALRVLLKDLVAEILREELADRAEGAEPKPQSSPVPASIAGECGSEAVVVTDGLLTERKVKRHASNGQKSLRLGAKVVVTPLARETARTMGVTLKQLDRR